jgi:hypothetical protein
VIFHLQSKNIIRNVRYIHREFIIADRWTEAHSSWKTPSELNDVKGLKSHAQVLLDKPESPVNL